MTIKLFRQKLRSDPLLTRAFASFLRHRRRQLNLVSQEQIRNHAQSQAPELSGAAFVRMLNRAAKGKVSEKNLTRIAIVLEFATVSTLLESFEAWRAADPASRFDADASKAAFRKQDGFFVLQPAALLRGARSTYRIVRRKASKSNRGTSYEAVIADVRRGVTQRVFIKTPTLDAAPSTDLEELVSRSSKLMLEEVRILERVGNVPGLAKIVDHGKVVFELSGDSQLRVPFVVTEWIDGDDLTEWRWVNAPERLLSHAQRLLETVASLHALDVRHGDISLSNVIITESGIYLCDFGEAALPRPVRRNRATPTARPNRVPRQARSENRPLERTDDVGQLGFVLAYLLTGHELDLRHAKTPEDVMDAIAAHLGPMEEVYQNKEPGLKLMLARALHPEPGDRASDAGELVQTLEVFRRLSYQRLHESPADLKVNHALSELMSSVARITGTDSIFSRIFHREVRQMIDHTRQMLEHGRLEVEGTRSKLIQVVLDLMASLSSRDDLFITATTPLLWNSANLGNAGRILLANELIACRGVRLKRLIVIKDEDLANERLEATVAMLAAQAGLAERLRGAGAIYGSRRVADPGSFIGVTRESTGPESVLSDGFHTAFIQKGESTVSLSLQLDQQQVIRRVSLWEIRDKDFIVQRLNAIEQELANAYPIDEVVTNAELRKNLFADEHEKAAKLFRELRRSRH